MGLRTERPGAHWGSPAECTCDTDGACWVCRRREAWRVARLRGEAARVDRMCQRRWRHLMWWGPVAWRLDDGRVYVVRYCSRCSRGYGTVKRQASAAVLAAWAKGYGVEVR